MTRLLIVSNLGSKLELARHELVGLAPEQDLEVFVLLCDVRSRTLWRPPFMRLGRFWRRAHAGLDAAVVEMTEMGIAADGLASDEPPIDVIRKVVGAFEPDEVRLAVAGAAAEPIRADLEEALEGSDRVRTVRVTWVSDATK